MSVITVSKENYDKEVLASKEPVIIDFWASWCGPCKMMSPIIDEIAKENPDIKVCKVNVDEQQELAMQFNIMSIPTIVAIKNTKVIGTTVGVTQKEKVLSLIK